MGSPSLRERPEMEGRKTDWMEDDGQRWVAAGGWKCRRERCGEGDGREGERRSERGEWAERERGPIQGLLRMKRIEMRERV